MYRCCRIANRIEVSLNINFASFSQVMYGCRRFIHMKLRTTAQLSRSIYKTLVNVETFSLKLKGDYLYVVLLDSCRSVAFHLLPCQSHRSESSSFPSDYELNCHLSGICKICYSYYIMLSLIVYKFISVTWNDSNLDYPLSRFI